MARGLFRMQGGEGKFLLSERFSQDSLENYFGTIRTRGGSNSNPFIKEMLDQSGSVRVQSSIAPRTFRGNSSRRRELFPDVSDSTPIAKRPRRK